MKYRGVNYTFNGQKAISKPSRIAFTSNIAHAMRIHTAGETFGAISQRENNKHLNNNKHKNKTKQLS